MPEAHEFFSQPHGNPPWCFCRDRECPGWAAYVAWHQARTGSEGEPDDDVIEMHRRITRTLAKLTSHYSELLGTDVSYNAALDLAAIEMAAESPG